MGKIEILNRIKELYQNGENIMDYLTNKDRDRQLNTTEDILISYDFQAGEYTEAYEKDPMRNNEYCYNLAEEINKLGEYKTILEAGVGEATTLGKLVSYLNKSDIDIYGFDISWSRIKYANAFLKKCKIENVKLFVGDLFSIPIKENSIDIVYTSHAIEPNTDKEKEILEELYRVTKKYLILVEPAYDLASEESKKRMIKMGYVTKLYETIQQLGYKVISHKLFNSKSANPLNIPGITIIEKCVESDKINPFCCPLTKSDLIKIKGAYYSANSMLAYPILDGIPCLLSQNAIVATKFLD